jgi:hypothetical protein
MNIDQLLRPNIRLSLESIVWEFSLTVESPIQYFMKYQFSSFIAMDNVANITFSSI